MTQPQLLDLKILARQAGAILREGFGRQHQVDYKSLTDIVTEIDRQSEEFLTGQVLSRFPGDTIQGEEGGLTQGENGRVWHIDPLDGTVNYAHGVPIFSVSLACAWDGAVQLGVVYDPMRDEMFSARRGQGAWLNDAPIHVSQTEELVSALLVTGFPYTIREQEATNLDHFTHFCMRARSVRRLGSAALDLCYVAAGRLDGYWEIGIHSWDVAAGGLIVEEAGGRVTTLRGDEAYFKPPYDLACANPRLQPQMLDVLRLGLTRS
ncbi:hypothetical protein ADN00_01375 [Ornatilinea apprima]|uniref:Inositol-1-monophosphatase n=1 Tax=Ornatilinea apprima TaxID=1134406 RepID=A0A0P6XCX5_9CHLR|nr:inositol monophosphatase family protein [Ornatilinea apprima]KPL80526.1 hypothetical protein ADN00_01375 [Ornatilinea apprima]